jgi:hypothetical protein
MTLIDHRPSPTDDQQTEALFKEARQRRRRRWLVSGMISVGVAVAAFVAVHLADGHPNKGSSQAARLHPRPLKIAEPTCQPPGLAISTPQYGDAGGVFGQIFTLTNTSSEACRLQGWPQLRVADASGRFVATPTQRVRQNIPPAHSWSKVDLKKGQSASFKVFGQLYDAFRDRVCPTTSSTSIILRGDTSPLVVPLQMPNCGTFDIAPLIKGATDRDAWSMEVPRM